MGWADGVQERTAALELLLCSDPPWPWTVAAGPPFPSRCDLCPRSEAGAPRWPRGQAGGEASPSGDSGCDSQFPGEEAPGRAGAEGPGGRSGGFTAVSEGSADWAGERGWDRPAWAVCTGSGLRPWSPVPTPRPHPAPRNIVPLLKRTVVFLPQGLCPCCLLDSRSPPWLCTPRSGRWSEVTCYP